MFDFKQHNREYYAIIYRGIKYDGQILPNMNPFEKMEYSYYNMQLAAGDPFPFNAIIMTKEWLIECLKFNNKPMVVWNDLKIFMDEDQLPQYAFVSINENNQNKFT